MTWAQALLKALALVQLLMAWAKEKRDRGAGRLEAVAEALDAASARVKEARAIEAEAAKRHAADPTDSAFDDEFRRR